MKRNLLLLAGALVISLKLSAAVLPPEQLLPADTLAVLTVPDVAAAGAVRTNDPAWQLWSDPALKPFREKLENKLNEEFLKPLESELGVKFADYADLVRGQWTLAIIQNGWHGTADPLPAWLLLMDAKDKKSDLILCLSALRQKLTEAGQKSRVEKIRDSEFTTVSFTTEDLPQALQQAFASSTDEGEAEEDETAEGEAEDQPAAKAEAKPIEITFGQFDSMLVVGSNPKVIEKVMIRQSNGPVPPLLDEVSFQKEHQARLRDSLVYGWLNFKPLVDVLIAEARSRDAQAAAEDSPVAMPQWSKMLSASGLTGLRSLSFNVKALPEGSLFEFALGVPADGRAGLFKVLSIEPKESGPAAFVPANAMTFQRVRLDLPKAWASLERTILDVFPQAGSVIDLMFQTAGKDKDPNYNLKAELLGNLGDDLISFDLSPRGSTFNDLNSAPSLFLLGAPTPDKLLAAVKAATALFPPPLSNVKEREFLGRRIYSINLRAAPNLDDAEAQGPERIFSFAAASGYVAMSTDAATLETYLRSAENPGKALRDTPGLTEAAQKVGGLSTGLFGYQNDAETFRVIMEALKNDSASLEQMLRMTPLAGQLGPEDGKRLKDWVDFSLLPPFDKIAQYFYFTVYAGRVTADGYSYQVFSPTPPQLRK